MGTRAPCPGPDCVPCRPAASVCHFFSEDKDSETDLESNFVKEMPSAPAEDGGDSEPSDEDAATFSAESRDTADEDTPGPAARVPERALVFDANTPASPQEPAVPGDGVDLLGLHSDAGPAPPASASGGPPSNADLLSSLLGTPEAAPEASPGDLLGGEEPLLFTSPAPPPGTRSMPRDGPGPMPASTCALLPPLRGFSMGPRASTFWEGLVRATLCGGTPPLVAPPPATALVS